MFLVRDLVSPRTWLAMTSHLAGLFLGLAVMVVFITGLSLGFSLLVLALVGLPILGLTLRVADWFARAERARLRLMLGMPIPAWPAGIRAGYRWGVVPRWRTLGERATWGEIGYGLLRLPFSAVAATLSIAAWAAGLVLLTLPLYNRALPSGGAELGDTVLKGTATMTASAVVGLFLLLAAPQLTRGLAAADAALARWLLGPRRDLAARVAELEISRERVVDAAEAERRRIERDLHDGAQQRLVSLAMNLGMARERFESEPEPVRQAIAAAHDEAVLALTELREFIRGLHPAVLSDRGLGPALSGLAARAPLPVRLRVDVPRPASPGVEAVAYFIVSEAIANVVKHAQATQAEVTVTRADDVLRITVTDDGRGGAAPAEGDSTGLRGLAQRAAAVDGTLSIDSPPGGPTVITAELPCES